MSLTKVDQNTQSTRQSKPDVDIAQLKTRETKTVDLADLRMTPVDHEARRRAELDGLRRPVLGQELAAIVGVGDRGPLAVDLTGTRARQLRAGELRLTHTEGSSLSLPSLSSLLGRDIAEVQRPTQLHFAIGPDGPVLNGRTTGLQFVPKVQLAMYQPPAPEPGQEPQPAQEKPKYGNAHQFFNAERESRVDFDGQALDEVMAELSKELREGGSDRLAVLVRNPQYTVENGSLRLIGGDVVVMPFRLQGADPRTGRFLVTAPEEGGARAGDADFAAVREALGLSDEFRLSHPRMGFAGNRVNFEVDRSRAAGLKVHYGTSPAGDPLPVLGILRRPAAREE